MNGRNRGFISVLGVSLLLIALASGFFLREVSGAKDDDQTTQTTPAARNLLGAKLEQTYALADFNGDGLMDVAVTDFIHDTISVLVGDRAGYFHPATSLSSGGGPRAIVAADFNGDGAADLAEANFFSGDIAVFAGRGDSSFEQPHLVKLGEGLASLAGEDFNSDGWPDLAVANFLSGEVMVLKGVADGSFAAPAVIGQVPGVTLILSGDSNKDGVKDLIAFDVSDGEARLFAGDGSGSFREAGNVDPMMAISLADAEESRAIRKLSGDGQSAQAGAALPQPLIVEVGGQDELRRDGKLVVFSRLYGDARVDGDDRQVTNEQGRVSLALSLGELPGNNLVAAASERQIIIFGESATLPYKTFFERIGAALAYSPLAQSSRRERDTLLDEAEHRLSANDEAEAVVRLMESMELLSDRNSERQSPNDPVDLVRRLLNQVLLLGSASPAIPTEAIICGETKRNRPLATLAQVDTYTFTAFAGEAVVITTIGVSGGVDAIAGLYDPAGTLIDSNFPGNRSTASIPLPSPGTYTIRVSDYLHDETGNYDINLQFTTGRCGAAISCGRTSTGNNLSSKAQVDAYTFTGNAGEAVLISTIATSGGADAIAGLYNPAGALIDSNFPGNRSTSSIRLTSSGTYTILVSDYLHDGVGNYDVDLQFTTGRCGAAISCGQTRAGNNLLSKAQVDAYTFTGNAGEAVLISTIATSGGADAIAGLYDPAGTLIDSNFPGNRSTSSIPLRSSGTYTILVSDYLHDGVGNYDVDLQFTTGRCGAAISCGQTRTGNNLLSKAQVDAFSFSGSVGCSVVITTIGISGGVDAIAGLYDPAGTLIDSNFPGNRSTSSIPLRSSGTYTILVSDYLHDETGAFDINLTCAGSCSSPNYNLTLNPSSVSAAPGGSVGSVATVASLNGFNGAVGLSCPNPPPGVSCSFTPNPVTPPANATASSGLTVAVGVGVMAGSYQLEVRGESGSLSRSATLSLAVQSAQDFAIACQPTSLTVTRNCGLARATCAVRSLNGFSSPVALSVEGGPTGVTTSLFTPVTPPPNGTADSAVAVSANADAPLGNHTIRVRGASGGLTRAADLTLTIQPSAGGLLLDESFSGGVAQDIVTNGDFETPDAGPGWVVYHAGQTFGGWTVESGTVEHKGVWQDARGRQSVDLTGVGAGAIYQDLATVPGQTYQLRFAMAGNPGGGPAVKRMEVWWGDTGVDTPSFDTTGRTSDDMGWRYQQYSVTATAAVTRLRFKSLIEGVWGPALDDVSVTRPASGGGAIPPAWTVIDGGSGGGAAATWTAVNPGNRNIGAPFTSPFAIVDSDSAGAAARQDEQLITPPFNASCCRQVILEFSNQFRRWSSEIADVDVSTDGGVNWINVLRMQGASDGYPTPNTKTIDITSAIAANPANARIRFHYYNGDWEWWWAIDNVRVRCESASPDFGLRLDPPAIDVLQTSSASSTVTITSTGGFNSPLRLSCEQPLPSGVRCGFNPATVTPSPNGAVTSLLTVSADAAATPGPHILNVLAQGDLIGRGVSFRVTVEPRPMFTINCQPDALVAPQGGMARSNCTLTSTGGFNSPVNLFCQNLPPGAQCGFSPNPVTPPANGSVGFTQTMSVGTNVAPGTYGYRVYGAPVNGLTQSFDRVLTVTPLEQVTFTVQGGCAPTDRVRVRLTPGGDFDTPVTLSYPRGQTVRLEAIASDIQCGILQAFFPFGHWEINGAPQPAQQRVINLTLTQNTTAFAKYLPRIIGPEPEQEPNELPSQANPISLPGGRTGVAAAGDATAVQIVYTNGDRDGIEDLFAVMLAESARLELTVSFTNAAADLDLFLLRIVGSSVSVLGVSNSGAATIERIVTNSALAPGVYYIGVSAWRGSSAYTLTAMKPELQLRSIHQPIGQTQSGEAAIDSRLTVWGQPANTVRVKTQ